MLPFADKNHYTDESFTIRIRKLGDALKIGFLKDIPRILKNYEKAAESLLYDSMFCLYMNNLLVKEELILLDEMIRQEIESNEYKDSFERVLAEQIFSMVTKRYIVCDVDDMLEQLNAYSIEPWILEHGKWLISKLTNRGLAIIDDAIYCVKELEGTYALVEYKMERMVFEGDMEQAEIERIMILGFDKICSYDASKRHIFLGHDGDSKVGLLFEIR